MARRHGACLTLEVGVFPVPEISLLNQISSTIMAVWELEQP